MLKRDEFIKRLTLDELRKVARVNDLPLSNTKKDMTSIIFKSSLNNEQIIKFLNINTMKDILSDNDLPRSGVRNVLEKRLLSILDKPPPKTNFIPYEKGHGFKKEVALRLKRYFRGLSPEIEMPARAKGLNVSDPYDVDIHMTIKGKGLFENRGDIWVECKWKDNSQVKRSEIQKLVISAQDAFRFASEIGGFYYDTLIIVSNQDFDIEALSFATAYDVLCLRFYEGQLIEKNAPENWVGHPAWMKQVND